MYILLGNILVSTRKSFENKSGYNKFWDKAKGQKFFKVEFCSV